LNRATAPAGLVAVRPVGAVRRERERIPLQQSELELRHRGVIEVLGARDPILVVRDGLEQCITAEEVREHG
jgi:hypothetical protein